METSLGWCYLPGFPGKVINRNQLTPEWGKSQVAQRFWTPGELLVCRYSGSKPFLKITASVSGEILPLRNNPS
jgi:hypothetical protein